MTLYARAVWLPLAARSRPVWVGFFNTLVLFLLNRWSCFAIFERKSTMWELRSKVERSFWRWIVLVDIWRRRFSFVVCSLRVKWIMALAAPRAKDSRVNMLEVKTKLIKWQWLHAEMRVYRDSVVTNLLPSFWSTSFPRYCFAEYVDSLLIILLYRCDFPLAHAQDSQWFA